MHRRQVTLPAISVTIRKSAIATAILTNAIAKTRMIFSDPRMVISEIWNGLFHPSYSHF